MRDANFRPASARSSKRLISRVPIPLWAASWPSDKVLEKRYASSRLTRNLGLLAGESVGCDVSQQRADPVRGCDLIVRPNQRGPNRDCGERQRLIGPCHTFHRFAEPGQHIGIGRDRGKRLAGDHGGVAQLTDDQRANVAVTQRLAYGS